jgi:hypothetical protein
VKRLREAGFTETQAEASVSVLADIVYDQMATKRDLKELELRLTIKPGAMLVAAIGVVAVLTKIL